MTQTAVFEAERPSLMALAYRMLGERAIAEDVVQEAWLRWRKVEPETLDNPPPGCARSRPVSPLTL